VSNLERFHPDRWRIEMPQDSTPSAKTGLLVLLAWIGGCTLVVLAWQVLTSSQVLGVLLFPLYPLFELERTGQIDGPTLLLVIMILGCVVGFIAVGASILWAKLRPSH
jgi:hypothetical protein